MNFPSLHAPATPGSHAPVVLLHGGNAASWMWEPQVAALGDRVVVTPDLPGFGARADERWPGLASAADDLLARIRSCGVNETFDLVGLSLGGVVALQMVARHSRHVRSALVSGVSVLPADRRTRLTARMQLAVWDRAWFWKVQAAAFRLPREARALYVRHALSVSRETAHRMLDEVLTGGVPPGLEGYRHPLLVVSGERDVRTIRESMTLIKQIVPQAALRVAPRMHHVWNIQDVDLFNSMLRSWFDGHIETRLLSVDQQR